jgi:hypothetical protein
MIEVGQIKQVIDRRYLFKEITQPYINVGKETKRRGSYNFRI